MSERDECRKIFNAKHMSGTSAPHEWSEDTRKTFEAAFELWYSGWQAALASQPAGDAELLALLVFNDMYESNLPYTNADVLRAFRHHQAQAREKGAIDHD